MSRRFRFEVDGRAAGPVRDRWEDAAADAVSDGYAKWGTFRETIFLSDQATIARLPTPSETPNDG